MKPKFVTHIEVKKVLSNSNRWRLRILQIFYTNWMVCSLTIALYSLISSTYLYTSRTRRDIAASICSTTLKPSLEHYLRKINIPKWSVCSSSNLVKATSRAFWIQSKYWSHAEILASWVIVIEGSLSNIMVTFKEKTSNISLMLTGNYTNSWITRKASQYF